MKLSQREGRARGFTLIELLVVISIVSLLTSVVLATLTQVRARSRNTSRIQTLVQLRNAMETYRDSNSSFPGTTGLYYGTQPLVGPPSCSQAWFGIVANMVPGLVPTYYPVEPHDVKENGPNCVQYLYISDGVDYKIIARGLVENGTVAQGASFARYGPTTICSVHAAEATYAIYSHNRASYAFDADPACW